MSNLKTRISWSLNNHCKAECSYCPIHLRGGEEPRHITDYLTVTEKIINHYKNLGRTIDWTFNGGEPLDMFDFPQLIKLCKDNSGTIDLTTNGGKLWLDWWAIEPHVDTLRLSYHYWQNPKLIHFILDAFTVKNKTVDVMVPIRPDYFDEDLSRALEIEKKYKFVVSKTALYNHASQNGGLFPYTDQQLRIIRGEELIEEKNHFEETTFKERVEEKIAVSPSFTNIPCNVGIETLNISHVGSVSGSNCNTLHLGNIWDVSFQLPNGPTPCRMIVCVDQNDQQITKFT